MFFKIRRVCKNMSRASDKIRRWADILESKDTKAAKLARHATDIMDESPV